MATYGPPDVVMAFIGETGSGKSTCINYFANFFDGKAYTETSGFSDIFVVIPNRLFPQAKSGYRSTERNINDNTRSQTTECNEYDLVYKNAEQNNKKIQIKIIDTPGLSDTDMTKDDENIQKIITKLANLPFISAVIITINGTMTRLSTSIRATLSQLRGSIPDSVFDNLFFILTNCDETTRNFDVSLLYEYKPQEQRIFHMQNSLFSVASKDRIDNDPRKRSRVEKNWQDSADTMKKVMTEVSRTAVVSTQVFKDMRIQREQLLVHKANLIGLQKSLLSVIHELNIAKEQLVNARTSMLENENHTQRRTVPVMMLEKKDYHSTVCNEHDQLQVCHENCGHDYDPNLSDRHFTKCKASDRTSNPCCLYCKCSMGKHYHTYEILVSKNKTIEEIIQSKKAAYDEATNQIATRQPLVDQLQQTMQALNKECDDCKNGILESIKELKKICTGFNFAEEMKTTIQKLRQEATVAVDSLAKSEFTKTADAIQELVQKLST